MEGAQVLLNLAKSISMTQLAFVASLALLFGCSGGGGKVTSLDQVEDELGIVVTVVSGQAQVAAPKEPVPQPIVFKFADGVGNNFRLTEVEYFLLDVTGNDAFGAPEILAAWNAGTFTIAADAESFADRVADEVVGRIELPETTTNEDGVAQVALVAPDQFQRTIAIAARPKGSNSTVGFTTYTTTSVGSGGENFVINSSNGLNEIAGDEFSMDVTVVRNGKLQSLDSRLRLFFEVTYPEGFGVSDFPAGEVECDFVAGRCRMPGGPFVFRGAGEVNVVVTDLDGNISSGTAVFRVEVGNPSGIVLSSTHPDQGITDACDRLDNRDNVADPCITISADTDVISYWPVVVDQGGNFIQATNSEWTVTGPLGGNEEGEADGIDARAVSGVQRVYPNTGSLENGQGILNVSGGGFTTSISYQVLPGSPATMLVASENGNIETATTDFKAQVTLFDRKGNLTDNFNESSSMNFSLTGANASPGAPPTQPVVSFTNSVVFTAGVGLTEDVFRAPNSTDVPIINVSGSYGNALSDPIVINPGPPYEIAYRTAPGGAGDPFLAPYILPADRNLTLYTAGYDEYGNFSVDVVSDFSADGALSGTLAALRGVATTVVPGVTGTGTITAQPIINGGVDPTTPIPSITSPDITISSSAAVALEIRTTNSNTEPAGQQFQIQILGKDVDGFVSGDYVGPKVLNFVAFEPTSWLGQQAELPEGIINCTFVAGVCNLPPPPSGGWSLTDADVQGLLSVEDDTGNLDDIPGVWSAFLTATPGTPDRIVFADIIGGEVGGATPYPETHLEQMTADDMLTLAAALVDEGGNYLSDATGVTFSGNIPVINTNLSPAGATVTYDPVEIVTAGDNGRITASNGSQTNATMDIEVAHGIPADIEFTFPGGLNVTAGDCFTFDAAIVDQKGNVTTSYNHFTDVKLGIANSTLADVDDVYDGAWDHPADGGRDLRFPGGFYTFDGADNRWEPRLFTYDAVFSAAPYDYNTRTDINYGGYLPLTIGAGELQHGFEICLPDPTASPYIAMEVPGSLVPGYINVPTVSSNSSATPFVVATGAAHHAHFTRPDGTWHCNYGRHFGAQTKVERFLEPDGDWCFENRSADLLDLDIRAEIHDAACNTLAGDASGTWTIQQSPGGSISFSDSNDLSYMSNQRGTYRISFDDPAVGPDAIRYSVANGVPDNFTILPIGLIDAASNFNVLLQLFDAHGNDLNGDSVATRVVNWAYETEAPGPVWNPGAPNGPAPLNSVPTLLADGPIDFQTSGNHVSASDFRLPRADETIRLTATIPTLPNDTATATINVDPGPLVATYLQDSDTLSGNVIDTITISTDDNLTWYVVGKDAEGNLTTNVTVDSTFTPSGVLTNGGDVTPSGTTRIIVTPSQTGSANINVTPDNGSFPQFDTTDITVEAGELDHFEVEFAAAPGNVMTANTTYTMTLTAVDANGNVVPDFDGTKSLTWNVIGASNNPEGRSITYPDSDTYDFTAGVADATVDLDVRPFNSSNTPIVQVTHIDGTVGLITGSATLTVNSGPFHHYGVIGGLNNYDPKSDRSTQFTRRIRWRDEAGNNLTAGGPNSPVTLTIYRDDGSAANGVLGGTTAGIDVFGASGDITINDLTYDEQGDFKVFADDGLGNTSTLTSAVTIEMNPTPGLIADYNIGLPAGDPMTRNAGSFWSMQITARDNYGNAVTGTDGDIDALTHSWSGVGVSSSPAPSNQPQFFGNPSFSNGVANISVAFYHARTINVGELTFSDDQGTPRTGTNGTAILINPGTLDHYKITPSSNTRDADNTASGLFSLDIQAYDNWDNTRTGDGSVNLFPVFQSGTALNTGSIRGPSNTTAESTGLDLSSGFLTVSNLYYNVGHEIHFNLSGGTATVDRSVGDTITFTATLNTVDNYLVSGTTSTIAGAGNVTYTLEARDAADNRITNIDGALDGQGYTWSGLDNSPGGTAFNYGALAGWSGGTTTATHDAYNARTYGINVVRVQDDYSGGARSGGNIATLTVDPAVAAVIEVDPIGSEQAGVAFTVDADVKDAYGNLTANGCTTATTSGGSTSPGGNGGTPTAPVHGVAVAQSGLGQYTSSNLTLYDEGADTINFNACSLSQPAAVTVTEGVVGPNGVYLTTTDSPPGSHTTELLCADTNDTGSDAAVSCNTLYAFFWDAYGNRVNDTAENCTWSYTTISGAPTPSVSGTAHSFTVSHSDYIDGHLICTRDGQTRSINTFGGISEIEIDHTNVGSPLLAGNDNFQISEIRLFYQQNGVKTPKTNAGDEAVTLVETSGLSEAQLGYSSPTTFTFDGTGTYNTTPIDFDMTLRESAVSMGLSIRGKTDSATGIQIDPANATQIAVLAYGAQVAGTPFTLTVEVRDPFNNLTDNGGSCADLTIAANGGAANIQSLNGTNATLPAASGQTALGTYQSGNITLVKAGTNSLDINACGLSVSGTTDVTVSNNTAVANVQLHTTDSDPGYNGGLTELLCADATGSAVDCAPVYAFFYDAYGNNVDGTSASCDAWSYTTIGGAPAPSISGTGHSREADHTDYIDGNLTCTENGVPGSILTYGGVSNIVVAHDPVGALVANNDNLNLTQIDIMMSRNGSDIAKTNEAASVDFDISTDSGLGAAGMGQSDPMSCAINASGQCTADKTFDMTLAETGRSITFTYRGKSDSITGINVAPNNATQIAVLAYGAQVAGVPFTLTTEVRDAFNNLTDNAASCANLAITATGGAANLQSLNGTAATLPANSAQTALGTYQSGNITLVKGGTNSLDIDACGLSVSGSTDVTVSNNTTVANVQLHTTDADPGYNGGLTELLCADATGSAVDCAAVYAFFYDAYGNNVDGTSASCDAWSYTTIGGAPAPGISGTGHSREADHTDYIDGNLTCTENGVPGSILTYGGVSSIVVAHDPVSALTANNDNLTLTQIDILMSRNGSDIAKTNEAASVDFDISTDSGLGAAGMGQSDPMSCAINASGQCTADKTFDMTLAETGRTITFTYRGKSDSITGINVAPNTATQIALQAVGAQTAGSAFTVTVNVQDAFNNPTDNAGTCADLVITSNANTTSPDGSTPTLPAASSQTALGEYDSGNITLVNEGINDLDLAACGLSLTAESVTVADTGTVTNVQLHTTDADPGYNGGLTELLCADATGSAVDCDEVFAFFFDTYGNNIDGTSASCDAWSYTTNSGAPAPSISGTGHSREADHTDYIDGNLTCTENSVPGSILTYGGVSNIVVAHDPVGSLTANNDNLTLTQIDIMMAKNGSDIAKTNEAASVDFDISTDSGLGAGGMGQADPMSCSINASGQCTADKTFDMTLAETGRTITFTYRGKSDSITGINVAPNTATQIALQAVGAQTAGTPFTVTVNVQDAFNNPTDNAGTCADLVISTNSNTTSPDGSTPTLPAASSQTALGEYDSGNITLVNEGVNDLDLAACGLNLTAESVTVADTGTVTNVQLHTTDADPGYNGGLTELLCADGTGSAVDCDEVYAFFFDTYGNNIDGTSASCDAWSYSTIGGAPAPTISGTGHSRQADHTDYIDGNLTCTENGVPGSILTYGGVSSIVVAHDPVSALTANNDNLNLTQIDILMSKNGSDIAKTNEAASVDFDISTDSGLGAGGMGQTDPMSCSINASGQCTADKTFDMTLAETGRTITFTYRGKSDSITGINVAPNTATQIALQAVGGQTAGTPFTVTVNVQDAFNNPTDNAGTCADLTISSNANTSSPDGSTPTFPAASSQTALGEYDSGNITLVNEGVNDLDLSACGLSLTAESVTVADSGTVTNVQLHTTNSDPGYNGGLTELLCADGTGSAVDCDAVYAFFFDAYGNNIDDTAADCDAWSYATIGGAPAPTISGTGHSREADHTDYIDGNLTCTENSVPGSILTYGGVSSIVVAHDPVGSLTANNDNLNLTQIDIMMSKNGSDIAKTNEAASVDFDISTDSGLGAGGMGQADPMSCSINASGQCTADKTFDMTLAETGRSITFTYRGKSDSITGINVAPNTATQIALQAVGAQTAGSAFTVTVNVQDAFNNPTDNAGTCSDLTISSNANTTSPDGSSPTFPAASSQTALGEYDSGNITLVNEGVNDLDLSACGLSLTAESVTVADTGTVTNVQLHTTDADPGYNGGLTELLCADGTGSAVDCDAVYAFFFDTYGNNIDDTSASCDAWSYSTIGGAPAPTISGTGHSREADHTDYIDGNLTCTENGVPGSILTYGGVSSIVVAHDPVGSLTANNDNLNLTQIDIMMSKNGSDIAKTNEAASVDFDISTDSGLGAAGMGQADPMSCSINASGQCTADKTFDMTLAETGRSITFTYRGKSDSITGINVAPNTATQIALQAVGAQVAGTPFTVTVNVQDAFNNPTDNAGTCADLVVSSNANTTSPDTSTPTFPAASSQTALGEYDSGNITLVNEGVNDLDIAACGLSLTAESVTVADSGTVTNVQLHTTNSDPGYNGGLTELLCADATGSAVDCDAVYAFFFDTYGNNIDGTSADCDAWSYSTIGGAPAPSISGTGHSREADHTDYIDGNLTCTENSVPGSILTYGGVSSIVVAHDPVGSLTANNDNLNLTQIDIMMSKNGSDIAKTNEAASVDFDLSTDSGLGAGGMGQSDPMSCSINASGQCTADKTFDMTLAETGRSITFTYRGKSDSITGINVAPNTATQIALQAVGGQTAGSAFTVTVNVQDAFNNPTDNAGTCADLTISSNANTTSPDGSTPTFPAASSQTALGEYDSGNITLVNEGVNDLNLNACGLSLTAESVTVADSGTVTNVQLHTTDSDPGYNGGLTELLCADGTGSAVDCDAVYAFFFDTYGNNIDGTSASCDAWSYSTIGGAPAPSISGTGHSREADHTDYIDGNLTCTENGVPGSILTYGGVSSIVVAHDPVGSLTANNDNLTLTQIDIMMSKNGSDIAKTNEAASVDFDLSTDSGLGAAGMGQSDPMSCSINASGQCTADKTFDMTLAETGRSITFSYRGKSDSITGINVAPSTATQIALQAVGGQTAGSAFTVTVNVQDAFNNPTDNAGTCADLTISANANTTSPDGSTPTFPAASSQTALGEYDSGNITLVNEGVNDLDLNACGLSLTAESITVADSGTVTNVQLHTTNSDPGYNGGLTEQQCANVGDTAAVDCAPVYAFFFDTYGNNIDGTSADCDAWSYSTIGGAPAPSISGTGHSQQADHTDFIDGNLTCTENSVPGSINTFGGLSAIELTHDYSGTVETDYNNINITDIQPKMRKNGSDIDKDDMGGSPVAVDFSSNSAVGFPGLGYAATGETCVFSGPSDNCTATWGLDFTELESSRSFTVTVRGKSASITGITTEPGAANTYVLAAIGNQVAGTTFNPVLNVTDQFGHPTASGCANVAVTTTASTSPGGHGGTAEPVDLPANFAQTSLGEYDSTASGGVTLYAEETGIDVRMTACGGFDEETINVAESTANVVYLTTTDTPPASHTSELLCGNTGSGAQVNCAEVFAFFWDAYGNRVDDASNSCDSWGYTDNASGSSAIPSVSTGTGHSRDVGNNADYVDGNLRCTKDGTNGDINLYGGLSRIALDHNYSGAITAGNGNVVVDNVNLYMRKNGSEVAKTDASGAQNLDVSTTSSLGQGGLGISDPFSCTFDGSGLCTDNISLNLTAAESGIDVSFTLLGETATISSMTVNPAAASQIALQAVGAQTAGTPFTITVNVQDPFNNPTNNGGACGDLTIATNNNTSSPDGSTPTYPAASGQTALGEYDSGNITLVNEGTNGVDITACGLTLTNESITVADTGTVTNVQLHTTNTDPGYNGGLSELLCADSTGSAVDCAAVYAFFFDTYGNNIDGTSASCDAWSYSTLNSAPAPSISGTGHSREADHSDYIDGNLTCTENSVPASINTYGGTSRIAIDSNYSGAITAANNNITIDNINLYMQKNGSEIGKTNIAGSQNLTLATTSSLGVPGIGQASPLSCTFDGSGLCTTNFDFSMTDDEDGREISLTFAGKSDAISSIDVNPGVATTMNVTVTSTATAGTPFTATVNVEDAFSNPTANGCGNLATTGGTTSSGNGGGSPTAPGLPSDVAQGSLGQYTTGNITLYSEGSNTVSFSACGLGPENESITVSEAGINNIWLNTTDTAPGSHTTSVGCTGGTTVTCPTLYAFAWDAYGNEIDDGTFTCNTWTYTNGNSSPYDTPDPSLSNTASTHSTQVTSTNWHVQGSVTCTVGGDSAVTNLTKTAIDKNYTFGSCSNWACGSTTPTATCTVTNNTGYTASAYAFGGNTGGTTLDDTDCASGQATGNSCTLTVNGNTGNASGNLTVAATEDDATIVDMLDPSFVQIQGGALAPDCTDTISQAVTTDWSDYECVAGASRWTVTLTNDNDLNSITWGGSDPSFSTANGATLVSTTCKSATTAPGATCTATIENSTAGVASTLDFAPTDGFFQALSATTGSSPNCSQDATISYNTTNSCGGGAKVVEITITNNNTYEDMTLPASAVSSTNGVISADGCDNSTVSAGGGSCTFTVTWNPAPTGSVPNTDITVSETGSYFNDVTIGTGDYDNSCP